MSRIGRTELEFPSSDFALRLSLAAVVVEAARIWVERAENQFAFKHSSRTLPWKLSTCPFCIGLPGWM
jgi:hypothetical protein